MLSSNHYAKRFSRGIHLLYAGTKSEIPQNLQAVNPANATNFILCGQGTRSSPRKYIRGPANS